MLILRFTQTCTHKQTQTQVQTQTQIKTQTQTKTQTQAHSCIRTLALAPHSENNVCVYIRHTPADTEMETET